MAIFWAVWRKDGGGAATVRHSTKIEAINEAKRLALATLKDYYVLQVIGCVEFPQPVEPLFNEDLEGDT